MLTRPTRPKAAFTPNVMSAAIENPSLKYLYPTGIEYAPLAYDF